MSWCHHYDSLSLTYKVSWGQSSFLLIGCRLALSDGSAILDIPEGALEEPRLIHLCKPPTRTDVSGPGVTPKINPYSPVVNCGPEGITFKKDVTLSFEHCAAIDVKDVPSNLAVFGRDNENSPWVKQNRFLVKGNRIEHSLDRFSQRCFGQEDSADPRARMRMCLMIAVPREARRFVAEVVLMRYEISLINVSIPSRCDTDLSWTKKCWHDHPRIPRVSFWQSIVGSPVLILGWTCQCKKLCVL
jgi:hypothetical protein